MGNNYNILVINPGSTSTKVGLYRDVEPIAEITVRHSREELAPYETIFDQYDFRLRVILDELGKQGIELNNLNAVSVAEVCSNRCNRAFMRLPKRLFTT